MIEAAKLRMGAGISRGVCTRVVTPFVCAEVREKLITRFHRTAETHGSCVSLAMLRWIFRLIVLKYAVKVINRLFASRPARRSRT